MMHSWELEITGKNYQKEHSFMVGIVTAQLTLLVLYLASSMDFKESQKEIIRLLFFKEFTQEI